MYRCEACGREYPPDGPYRCECGHALDYAARPLPDGGPPDQIREAIDATDGAALAVDAAATTSERDRLARKGSHAETTSATATAALSAFRDRGELAPDDDVVVALTGRGLKG
jgi:threonine synthase